MLETHELYLRNGEGRVGRSGRITQYCCKSEEIFVKRQALKFNGFGTDTDNNYELLLSQPRNRTVRNLCVFALIQMKSTLVGFSIVDGSVRRPGCIRFLRA